MSYTDFLGQVQHRIEAGSREEAVRTTRSILETLGERVNEGEATDIASPLPLELDRYLLQVDHSQKMDASEFIDRVNEKLNYQDISLPEKYSLPGEVDRSETVYRIKAVFDLLAEKMPGKEMNDIRQQLPPEYDDFFQFIQLEDKPWDKE